MAAGTFNLTNTISGNTYDGATFTINVNASPLDLTGLTGDDIKCEIRADNTDGTVVKTLNLTSGITIDNAAGGVFSIDAFDVTFGAGLYYYDIRITIGTTIKTYVAGTWTILDNVTE